MNRPLTFISVAAAGLVAYAVYFDYTRRNDPKFRKSLKKRAAKMEKEKEIATKIADTVKTKVIKEYLIKNLVANPPPSDVQQKELYFLEQISMGERLSPDPSLELEAAMCFYKALAVYPNPTDVLGVYKNSVPENVFEIIERMIKIQNPATVDKLSDALGTEAQADDIPKPQSDLD
ncbi:hypothetical protein C7M61_001734 [Candidozyma pseudohaemuli]|uniref:Protein import receptor MAS20 n=1 Tax=Candidozyma pseudohaemuli TaxID=418784 RepID=A0A2P7YVD4_9ASCO|nr:hypothetical protein C7M61_001734 [[Candida] pseudohaemulonii]PSK39923.1 hypothetical protein C7M61_001734 [[Candida] pseudohaemulonii]